MKKFIISENDAGQTLLNFTKKIYSTTPLSVIYKWFRCKDVMINGKRVKDFKLKINEGDQIIFYNKELDIVRENKEKSNSHLSIAYIDDNVLIAIKEAGVPVHDEYNESLDIIVNSYLWKNKTINLGKTFKISHAHRLDKPTTGLVIYPLTKKASLEIYKYINDKNVIKKYYIAKCQNDSQINEHINGYIKYDPNIRQSVFSLDKKDSQYTACQQIIKKIGESFFEIKLLTGKKHQIRAIFSYYNMPLENDYRYGAKKIFDKIWIGLLAYKLEFNFPQDSPLCYLNKNVIKIDYNDFFHIV